VQARRKHGEGGAFSRGQRRSLASLGLTMVATVSLALLAAGCRGDRVQSMLHPAGDAAARVAWLWWLMFAVLAAVTVLVFTLLALAIWRARRPEPPGGSTMFIVGGGIVMPTLVLVALQVFSIGTTVALRTPAEGMTIEVIGHQWWWEVNYPQQGIRTANELHIPVGEPVRLKVTAADVIHSFWVPQLNGKIDMVPDHVNLFWLQADRPGVYRGQCAEYCGLQHALMAFDVVALPRNEFDAWVARQVQPPPPPPPTDPALLRGQRAFFDYGCNTCHAIAGTDAVERIGPDLTHIGSRRTLGAGTIANTHGGLAGWVANPQPIKPGNLMPATYIPPEDFHALVDYLRSLQ
jgi:cytochrome c oxidase subunit II